MTILVGLAHSLSNPLMVRIGELFSPCLVLLLKINELSMTMELGI